MISLFEGPGLGSLRADYDTVDWAATALGPVERWSATLRSTVTLVLNTRFPVALFWGPQFVLVYNEGYAAMIGAKHPAALGAPAEAVFPEVWQTIGPMMIATREQRTASFVRDERLFLERDGFVEETYFTFSYSPVLAPDGTAEGVIDIATETTDEVVDRRRLALVAALTGTLGDIDDPRRVVDQAVALLRRSDDDLRDVDIVLSDAADASDHLTTTGPAGDGELDVATPRSHRPQIIRQGEHDLAVLSLGGLAAVTRGTVLRAVLNPHRPLDEAYLGFIQLVGMALTQALDRAAAHELERAEATVDRLMSETLQQALLTQAPKVEHLRIAARYLADARQATVGGDWYDAFLLPSGTLTLVVGDIAGHDRHAAANMAHVRGLLRGIAFSTQETPAGVLRRLDATMQSLAVEVLGTAVVAQIEQPADHAVTGRHTLRWSSAGHLPGLVVTADGDARWLDRPVDLMLGISTRPERHDHEITVDAGSTVLFYTDGLIERRDAGLDERLGELAAEASRDPQLDGEALCDRLLQVLGGNAADDIVLLALQTERLSDASTPDA